MNIEFINYKNLRYFTYFFKIMFKKIKNKISKNLFIFNEFIQSNTPIKVIYYFYRDKLKEKNLQLYVKDHDDFKKFISNLNFTTDWFTCNIPYWISIFNKLNIDRKKKLKCLEIGSFQGLSTIFILNYFNCLSNLTKCNI